ncbi:cleavage and polyadenylation specificity factor subunit 2 [Microcaecilia unicolor]|uniref:Cleavage and polyadenylation specificity factor subunit 2 n=1 Tax=Microcaecilia unicolor TaxID=1415580 RepID=A0A6P7YZB2_9AMPH|nr:cleavage and polyadenylation specificity factor subunit 2 [Microcaecilia unicolor]XP_030069857.1 cleavage and polyadenylation specificity factor subunit 2 [Microcaecilia unicolor]XP_030069858.1 cleavage and polyadenylation specificity factor subunit 2 [Microcaecilia unicolor]
MTSIIKLTTVSGVQEESALCYLLQVDEFRFLLDCGWDENFSMDIIDSLRKYAHQVDAVLLSHPDPLHLGALPYAIGKLGLNCAIYATIPVYKMGQMFMYDLYQSRHNTEDFSLFTLDDVDSAFDKIQQLKFSQIVNLKGKGHGLSITPLPAGHMIGGTIWKIVKDGEEEIVYAVDFNHKREIHLNGCSLEMLSRPSLLITDCFNATYVQPRRKQRDEQLLTNVLETLRGDGNVLIAVDTAGRVLELAQLLDQIWRTKDAGLGVYSLALLNNVSYNVVEFSKSQVEWMSDKLMRCFEDKRNNPFQFRHLSLCHGFSDLSRVPSPKVVLASQPDLECGFSRELFIQWCQDPKNSIILTYRTTPGTLTRFLIDNPDEKVIDIELRKRVKLEGKELEEHLEKEKLKKEAAKKLEQSKEADIDSSDESDAEEDIDQPSVHKTKHDLMMKGEGGRKGGFFKQAKKSYPMFPAPEERIKWDEYGEIIKPEDFLVPELQATEEEKSKLELGLTNGDEPMDQDLSDVPTKCVSTTESMEIKARVSYIDYEGRSDGDSIKKIINQMKPRQLVIVHGPPEACQDLAESCRAFGGKDIKVYTPKLHETIDATSETHIYQVRLKDSLVSSLQFCKAKDAELAWIDGILDMRVSKVDTGVILEEGELREDGEDSEMQVDAPDDDPSAIAQQKAIKSLFGDDEREISEESEVIPTLEPLPQLEVPGHQSVFMNEPRLSDFKQVLLREGIQAEFVGGVLVCNNVVAVRRTETGRIGLEGCLSDEFYRIRDLLYQQYAIV